MPEFITLSEHEDNRIEGLKEVLLCRRGDCEGSKGYRFLD